MLNKTQVAGTWQIQSKYLVQHSTSLPLRVRAYFDKKTGLLSAHNA